MSLFVSQAGLGLHAHLGGLLVLAEDTVPKDEDVVAGAWGAATFVCLLVALAILGYSLNKHLRKAQEAKEAGAFDGDEST
ncbi:MAG: hypothetical protein ACRCYU_21550 [Nocardioides sp.]